MPIKTATKIHTAGLFRCCIDSILNYLENNEELPEDGAVLDCEHEPEGNQLIKYSNFIWSVNIEKLEFN
jgi:hypothetical protein